MAPTEGMGPQSKLRSCITGSITVFINFYEDLQERGIPSRLLRARKLESHVQKHEHPTRTKHSAGGSSSEKATRRETEALKEEDP